MAEDVPFLAWSISEVWSWLVNVPYLGVFFLALLGLVVLVVVIYVFAFLMTLDKQPPSTPMSE